MRGRLCEPERCRFEVVLNIHNYVIFSNYSEILINYLFIVKDFSLTGNCSGRPQILPFINTPLAK